MTEETSPSLLDTPLKKWIPLNYETLIAAAILVLAVISRFYDLGARAMSHDEINHVVPTYSLYTGYGYTYDPMSHGPLQFHLIALSYALFGDNDFTSRIPAALFGVATVAVGLLLFRRYLGSVGAIAAGLLLLISPYLLFYGRYARNEIFIVLWALLLLYSVLRYLERGERWVLVLFVLANAFHFTDKATSYMFAGGIFIFLFFYFIDQAARGAWPIPPERTRFLLGTALFILLSAAAGIAYLLLRPASAESPFPISGIALVVGLALLALGALALAVVAALRGLGLEGLHALRSLDLLLLLGTLMLPMTAAIPLEVLGLHPLDYSPMGLVRIFITVLLLGGLGAALGLFWFGRRWLLYAALFFIPILVFYTTFFTNPGMAGSGFVGAFAYWLEQHGEKRGSQPIFYYALVQVPIYEFLPAIGTFLATLIAAFGRLWRSAPGHPFSPPFAEEGKEQPVPTAALLVYWSAFSLAIFSYAGERMPWLTCHITLPMILATAWAIGWLLETAPERLGRWQWRLWTRFAWAGFLAILAVITGRAAYRAAYINYDYALEYLVYAHGAPDPKALFQQIEEISYRITGTTDLVVAYDNMVRYPYWWYMRRYPNKIDFDVNPSRDVRRALIIAASPENAAKLAPVVQKNYIELDGMRLWWQNQDYWSLKWENISYEYRADVASQYIGSDEAIPEMGLFDYLKYAWRHIRPIFYDRAVQHAVWDIWFNRDFTRWGELRGNPSAYTLTNWGVADRMKIYLRQDLSAQLWPYGAPAQTLEEEPDIYAERTVVVQPLTILGLPGSEVGYFQAPRQIALAPDGTLYIADSRNHRIQHITQDGQILHVWGSFGDVWNGTAAPGTFNEPWGVAVSPDGQFVYVADTWNFRIQKFTADGRFVTMWSSYSSQNREASFYGPRGLAVDRQGRLFVADTGNKKIVIFDPDGRYLGEIGGPGMLLGQFDEPVGIAFDAFGNLYVTDTWNQRVQVFAPDASGLSFFPMAEWPVYGWYGQSLENKPFVTVGANGNVFVTDPEMCRLIEFTPLGEVVRVWDGCAAGAFQMPSGIVTDGADGLWVSDAANGALTRFVPSTP